MDYMNKYTLRFKTQEMEIQYQSQSIQNLIKPLYYALLVMTLILNALQSIITYLVNQIRIPFINIGFVILSLVNIFVIYRRGQLTSKMMTLLNFYVLLLQVDFDPNSTYNQEYFLYGSNFSLIQAITYFATDFYMSCPSVVLHLIFRQTVTILFTNRFDLVSFGLSLSAGVLVSTVLYICNKTQRLQFLLSQKEDLFTNQLKSFINKPFAKIKYNEKKLELNVQTVYSEISFIGYQSNLCSGCNMRQFIRNCQYNNESFEKIIINSILQNEESFNVNYLKSKLKLRIIKYDIDNSVLLILDQCSEIKQNKHIIPKQVQNFLSQQFSAFSNKFYFQQFKFGVMSILLLNQFHLKPINLDKLLRKMLNIYKFKNQNLLKKNQTKSYKYDTYCQLMKVFLIQIFNILKDLELQKNYISCIHQSVQDQNIVIQFILDNKFQFLSLYYNNFFIEHTQKYLLSEPLKNELIFYFNTNQGFNELNQK